MRHRRRINAWRILLFGLVALTGCGGRGLVPVKGTLKVDGRPVANATVQLIPGDSAGKQATATTDANGVFRLSTVSPGDGVQPGSYKVVVQLAAETEGGSAKTPDEAQFGPGAARIKRPSIVLPAKFSQPDQTVLKHKVPDDGDLKLELQSEKR